MAQINDVREYLPEARLGHLDCSYVAVFDGGTYDLVPDGCVDVLYRDDGALVVCGPESRGWTFRAPVGATSDPRTPGRDFRPYKADIATSS